MKKLSFFHTPYHDFTPSFLYCFLLIFQTCLNILYFLQILFFKLFILFVPKQFKLSFQFC